MKIKKTHIFAAAVLIPIIGTLLLVLTMIRAKTDTTKTPLPSIDDVPKEHWAELAQQKIFFGHKSVGYNILDGVKDIMAERPYIKLDIVETADAAQVDQPVFAHATVGKNTDPDSKIRNFKEIMDDGVAEKVDIAFLKFCYVDVYRASNPQEIFDHYSSTLKDLEQKYPETKFMHVTVPIRSAPVLPKKIIKESIKRVIGKAGVLDDNMKRQSYNRLLTEAYSGTASFFDLALAETVNPDGFCCYSTKGGERVPLMVSQYTYDGGHLNEKGRKKVAEQMLIALAQLANQQ